jgi:hypothetical protein
LVIRRGIAPVLGKATMAWRRSDVRWARYATEHPVTAARLQAAGTRLARAGDQLLTDTPTLIAAGICGLLCAGGAVQLADTAGIEHRLAWLASLLGCLLGFAIGAALVAAFRRGRGPIIHFVRTRSHRSERRWLGRPTKGVFSRSADPDPAADPPTTPLRIVPPMSDGDAQ